MVYVVVEPGVAVTFPPVVALKPVAGLHVYVTPPDAVRFTLLPLQIVAEVGATVIVGEGLTVILTLVSFEHEPLLTVTVYDVVTNGLAVTEAPVVALSPVAGLHE